VYKDYGVFGTSVIVEPGRADEVFAAVDTIAAQLRDKPIDADILVRARTPILENIVKSRRENGYWLGLAGRAQSESARLDRTRNVEARYKAVTAADIQAMARKYLRDDRELKIRIVHDSVAAVK
jgi:zinc protease